MSTYPQTGSTLVAPNGANITSTAVSTNILITVGPTPVGAVQRMNITEARNITMINEVSTDGSIDSVPTSSTVITGSCDRIRFDRMRLTESMGRDYVHIKSQRYPFNIVIIDMWNGNPLNPSDNSQNIITTIQNVWFSELSYDYQADNWIITDKANFKAETIYSTLGTGNASAATGGTRNIPLSNLAPTGTIEQLADIGTFRGSLSAPGIINSFLNF